MTKYSQIKVTTSPYKYVSLRLHKIECVESTKEWGKDEIVLSFLQVQSSVSGSKELNLSATESCRIGPYKMNAKKKDTKSFSGDGKLLAKYPIGSASLDFPRYFPGSIVLIEEDKGKAGALIADILDKFNDELCDAARKGGEKLGDFLSALVTGEPIPVVGKIFGELADLGLDAAIQAVINARESEVFPPENYNLKLSKFPSTKELEGTRKTRTISGHGGKYKVTTSWLALKS